MSSGTFINFLWLQNQVYPINFFNVLSSHIKNDVIMISSQIYTKMLEILIFRLFINVIIISPHLKRKNHQDFRFKFASSCSSMFKIKLVFALNYQMFTQISKNIRKENFKLHPFVQNRIVIFRPLIILFQIYIHIVLSSKGQFISLLGL